MLEPTVQIALVTLLAYLLNLAAQAVGLPLDEGTLTAVAVAFVAYIVSKFAGPKVSNKIAGK